MILGFSWPNIAEKCDRDPRIFLAQSATHYKFGMDPRFSWPKINSVKTKKKRDRDPRIKLIRSATY